MPEDYPDFPSAALMCKYLRAYADHWGITEHVELNTEVARLEPLCDAGRGSFSTSCGWMALTPNSRVLFFKIGETELARETN